MTQPFPHHPRAPTLHSRPQPGADVTSESIPASVRDPARGKAGEVGWVRTLAKILQLGCSKPLGSLSLPLTPSRVNSVLHIHAQPPSPLSLICSPLSRRLQLNSQHPPLPPPHCPTRHPSGPTPRPRSFSDHQPHSFQESLLNLFSIVLTSGGARVR